VLLALLFSGTALAAGFDSTAQDRLDQGQTTSPAPSTTTPYEPKYAVPPPAVAPPATGSYGAAPGGSPATPAPSPSPSSPQPAGAAPEASPSPQPGVAAASSEASDSSGSGLLLILLVAVPVGLATLLIVVIKRHPDWFARHGFGAR
jgi:hypothetical protein